MSSSYRCTRACWFRFSLELWVLYVSFVCFSYLCQCVCFVPGKSCLQNDLLCVEGDVKLYSLTHVPQHERIVRSVWRSSAGIEAVGYMMQLKSRTRTGASEMYIMIWYDMMMLVVCIVDGILVCRRWVGGVKWMVLPLKLMLAISWCLSLWDIHRISLLVRQLHMHSNQSRNVFLCGVVWSCMQDVVYISLVVQCTR